MIRRAKQAAEKARLRKVNVAVYSSVQTLTITPAPIVLSLGELPQRLKPGASIEISVEVERLYAYDDAVDPPPDSARRPGGHTEQPHQYP